MATRTPGHRLFSSPPPLYVVLEVLLLLGSVVLAVALLGDLRRGVMPASNAALAAARGNDADIALPDEDACAIDVEGAADARTAAAAAARPGSHRHHRHRHHGGGRRSANDAVTLPPSSPAPGKS